MDGSKTEMKCNIYLHIRLTGDTTFPSLIIKNIEGLGGDLTLRLKDCNAAHWKSISQMARECLFELLANNYILLCTFNGLHSFRITGKINLNKKERRLFTAEAFNQFVKQSTQEHAKQYEETRNRIKILLAVMDKKLPPKSVYRILNKLGLIS